jgi:hypothetical protein
VSGESRHPTIIILPALFLLVLAVCSGCGRGEDTTSVPTENGVSSDSNLPSYPPTLSAQSSPEEVAQILIKALDTDDGRTLRGLAAIESSSKDVSAIYRKYGKQSPMQPEDVAKLVAAGWRATYAFFESGETQIQDSTLSGDSAVVMATGKAPNGDARRLRIKLVREDGLWKVCAGLESLPGK